MTLLVNLPLLVLAWFYLSRRFALRTAVACGICSIILDYVVAPICPVYAGDRMMSSLYGGILVGIGMAFIFLSGSIILFSNPIIRPVCHYILSFTAPVRPSCCNPA